MNDLNVAILGCGPAGLMATHAVALSNKASNITVFSKKRKSPLYGAQYLHAPIPGVPCGDPTKIEYSLVGEAKGYRDKVYGNFWRGEVSPEVLRTEHMAWDIRRAYAALWDMYEPAIEDVEVRPIDVHEIMQGYDLVINSIPAPSVCHGAHRFDAQAIIAAGDAPDLGIDIGSMYRCDDNKVVCNGDPEVAWYRKSRIFGHTTVEWPEAIGRVPITSAATVRKPLWTDCDCWPGMVKVGRFGRWKKGVLSHTAFSSAAAALFGSEV